MFGRWIDTFTIVLFLLFTFLYSILAFAKMNERKRKENDSSIVMQFLFPVVFIIAKKPGAFYSDLAIEEVR